MIKIICDFCKKEVVDEDFACDINIVESNIYLEGQELNTKKQFHKKIFQICKKCFSQYIQKYVS